MKRARPEADELGLSNLAPIKVFGCEGLTVRALVTADHPAIVDILLNPHVWEQGFGDGFAARPTTPAEAYRFLYQEILTPDRVVFALDLDGEAIGTIAYYLDDPNAARAEVSRLLLAESHWGRGYMGAALDGLVRYAFELGYHRLAAEADELNGRSIRTFTRAGFMLEGIRRHSSFHADGSRRDICIFSITLDDEDALRRLRVKLPA